MRIDGIQLQEGSTISNLTVASGLAFPNLPNVGELFYLSGNGAGLYFYTGTEWVVASSSGGSFTAGNGLRLLNGVLDIITASSARITVGPGTIDLASVTDNGTGSFVKVTRDVYGRVIGTTAVTTGDVTPLLDATYVNVAGDTMTGALAVPGVNITGPSRLRGSYGAGGLESNLAIGDDALTANTTGQYNTAVGPGALNLTTTGQFNTGVGVLALEKNTTGQSNSAFGAVALNKNTTGVLNTGLGYSALFNVTTGNSNTAVGASALAQLTTGTNNTVVGYAAGMGVTGGYNTLLGHNAGFNLTTGSNNTFVGGYPGTSASTLSDTLILSTGITERLRISSTGALTFGPSGFVGQQGQVLTSQGDATPLWQPQIATKLQTARTISATGDAAWATTFDGSVNVTGVLTLATTNFAPVTSSFSKITTNAKGLVTATTPVLPADVTAANIFGGAPDQIPYQSAVSTTAFSTGLTWSNSSKVFKISDGSAGTALELRASNTLFLRINAANQVSGNAGSLAIGAGDTQGTGNGGSLYLSAGGTTGSGAPGNVSISSGVSATVGGYIQFNTAPAGSYLERMRIDMNGNVGIGTSSPGAKLDIVTGSTNRFRMAESGSSLYFDSIDFGATGVWMPHINRATQFLWLTKATGQPVSGMLLDTAGNLSLGILNGTTRLTSNVTDAGTSSVVNTFDISHYTTATPVAGFGVSMRMVLPDAGGTLIQTGLVQSNWVNPAAGVRTAAMTLWSSAANALMHGITIDHTGFVGMGTTTPAYRLDVISTTNSAARIRVSGTSTNITSGTSTPIVLQNSNATAGNHNNFVYVDANNNVQGGFGLIYGAHTANGQGTFYIEPRIVSSPTSFVVKPVSGFVGMGTFSPLSQLDVNGDITVRGNILGPTDAHAYTISANTAANVVSGAYIQLYASGSGIPGTLFLGAGGQERMRLTNNGFILFGTNGSLGNISPTGEAAFPTGSFSSYVRAGNTAGWGYIDMRGATEGAHTGYVQFFSGNGVRQGYIGFSTSTGSQDTGTIPFVMGKAEFNNSISSGAHISAVGTIIAGSFAGTIPGPGDIVARRSANQGVYYFGDSSANYLFFDGSKFNFSPGFPVVVTSTTSAGQVIIGSTLNGGIFGTNSSGNMHIDADGTKPDGSIYLNYHSGKTVKFCNGTGGVTAQMSASGYLTAAGFNGSAPNVFSTTAGTAYHTAVQMREVNGAGAQGGSSAYAPRLGFHWGGVVASSITIEPSGRIAIMNNPGDTYEHLACNAMYALSYTGTVAGSTYGAIRVDGLSNGFSGVYLSAASGTVIGMVDVNGNGGTWDSTTGWQHYWSRGNACLGLGGTTTASGYRAYTNGSHYVGGNIVASGTITGSSDARLKTNVEPITNALEKVKQLDGVTFEKIDEPGRRHAGLIAQNLETVHPEAVYEDHNGMKTVAYGNTVGLLIEAIKELTAKVESLQAQLDAKE